MRVVEYPEREPPRLCGGTIPARQRQIAEMRAPLIAREIGDEELPAPRVPVVSVPRAVERHAEDALRAAVLCEYRRDVRVMMLHVNEGNPLRRRARREIPAR